MVDGVHGVQHAIHHYAIELRRAAGGTGRFRCHGAGWVFVGDARTVQGKAGSSSHGGPMLLLCRSLTADPARKQQQLVDEERTSSDSH